MARGQERQITGGQLDPYVQESLGRGRTLAENRLIAAMKESGAAARQRSAQQASAVQQGAQLGAEAYQAAAERKQQERQFARMEEGRRQDRIMRDTNEKAQMKLQKEIIDAQLAEQVASRKEAHEDREKAVKRAEAASKAQMMLEARNNFMQMNALTTFMKARFGAENAKQKVFSAAMKQEEDAQQNLGMYKQTTSRVPREVVQDKRMDRPPQGEFEPVMHTVGFGMTWEAKEKEGTRAAPWDVVSSQIKKEGSKISIGDMASAEAMKLKISKGEIDSQDIAVARGVIDAIIPVFEDKAKKATETQWKSYRKKYNDKMYWEDQIKSIRNMKINISRLVGDKTPVAENKNVTVGSVIATGLGPIDGINFGSSVMKIMQTNPDYGKVFEEYTKEVDPYARLEITPDMDEDLVEQLSFLNSIYDDGRAQAEKASGERKTAATNWGAE